MLNLNSDEILKAKLKEFSKTQEPYIELEMNEEVEQVKKLVNGSDLDEIESRGILLRQTEFYSKFMTVFGRYELRFKRSNYHLFRKS